MNDKELPSMYSLTQIGIATFLGTPLAAGYMLAANYAALGQRRMGIHVAWVSLVVVILFGLIPVNPITDPGLSVAVLVGQVVLALVAANQLQGKMLASFESMGGKYHPMIRAVAVGLITAFVLTAVILIIVGPPAPAP